MKEDRRGKLGSERTGARRERMRKRQREREGGICRGAGKTRTALQSFFACSTASFFTFGHEGAVNERVE